MEQFSDLVKILTALAGLCTALAPLVIRLIKSRGQKQKAKRKQSDSSIVLNAFLNFWILLAIVVIARASFAIPSFLLGSGILVIFVYIQFLNSIAQGAPSKAYPQVH